jgi:hypothetical protein
MCYVWFSETSIDLQQTTRHYIPENRNLYNHPCEKLNYAKFLFETQVKHWVRRITLSL